MKKKELGYTKQNKTYSDCNAMLINIDFISH